MKITARLLEPLVLGVLLLAYGNGLGAWAQRRGYIPEEVFRVLNPLLLLLMLVYAADKPGGLAAMGVRHEGLGRSVLGGMALGLGLSGPPLVFFYRPVLLDTPLEYGPVADLSRKQLLGELFVRLTVSVAVFEELAFRGLLYSSLRRRLPAPASVALSAAAFAGWHYNVTATTAEQTNLADAARLPRFLRPYLRPLTILGGMLSTGLAGACFGVLRERTGNLAGAIVAHWLVDSIMVAALWRGRPGHERRHRSQN